MSKTVPESLSMIPPELMISEAIFSKLPGLSHLLPQDKPELLQGPLGDYCSGGELPPDNPAHGVLDLIDANRQRAFQAELDDDGNYNPEARKARAASHTHKALAQRLGKAYMNCLADGSPWDSLLTMKEEIDDRERLYSDDHDHRHGYLSLRRESLRRNGLLSGRPTSQRAIQTAEQILTAEIELVELKANRLLIEYLSAQAIVGLFAAEVAEIEVSEALARLSIPVLAHSTQVRR